MTAILTADGSKSVAGMHVRKSGGTKEAQRGSIRTADGLSVFFLALDYPSGGSSGGGTPGISVNPTSVGGAANSSSSQLVTTNYTTVTVAGGVAPFTYAWASTSTPTNPSAASTAFQETLGPGDIETDTAVCTVTDATGKSAVSPTVALHFKNLGGTL